MSVKTMNSVPEHLNITEQCLDRHRGTSVSNREAMVFLHENGQRKSFTYDQLADQVDTFADVLKKHGVEKGERVLIRLTNVEWFPISFFAALKIGAVPVPSSMLLAGDEVVYLLKDSASKVLVTEPELWTNIREQVGSMQAPPKVLLTEKISAGSIPAIQEYLIADEMSTSNKIAKHVETRANDPAYLVYTSGTTGFPKGVLHAHRALIGRIPASTHWFNFIEEERILHSGKFNWTYVLGTAMMDPLFHGKTVVVYEGKNDASGWIRTIADEKCTTFIGVPTIYRQILQKTECTAEDVPTLRHCMCAGEHLSEPVLKSWQERFGVWIFEGLGMSEISYYISQSKFDEIRPGMAGKVQPGHIVSIMDGDMKEAEDGDEGVICIHKDDPGLFLEYWKLPEQTEAAFKEGWFVTGDYAIRDREGYIRFLGRRDDIIKSFGYRISPYEIERVMKGHPDIADCAAVGEVVGEDKTIVTLCVILKPGANENGEELLAWSKGHLADYKRPKSVKFFSDFPRTANGKIIRKSLINKVNAG